MRGGPRAGKCAAQRLSGRVHQLVAVTHQRRPRRCRRGGPQSAGALQHAAVRPRMSPLPARQEGLRLMQCTRCSQLVWSNKAPCAALTTLGRLHCWVAVGAKFICTAEAAILPPIAANSGRPSNAVCEFNQEAPVGSRAGVWGELEALATLSDPGTSGGAHPPAAEPLVARQPLQPAPRAHFKVEAVCREFCIAAVSRTAQLCSDSHISVVAL